MCFLTKTYCYTCIVSGEIQALHYNDDLNTNRVCERWDELVSHPALHPVFPG